MPELLEERAPRVEDSVVPAPVREVSKPRRSGRIKWVLGGALLLLAVGGTWTWLHYRYRVSTDDAQIDAHITAVAPRVGGSVAEVLIDDNQQVKAGDVLLRIDPRDYQARVDQARAAVVQAQSQLNTARTVVPLTSETTQSGASGATAQLADARAELERARITAQQAATSGVAEAEANVRSKQASNDRAQADLRRMHPLLDKAEISQLQYDAYVASARVAESEMHVAQQQLASSQQAAQIGGTNVTAAQSRVEQAQAQVESSLANRRQVDVRRAEAGSAAAAVEAAQANLAAAELELSYTTIASPVDGVVTRKTVEKGQTIQSGQSLMTIVPLQGVWVTANFKETQLAGVHPGQKAVIHVDMYGQEVEGHVESIAGATGSKFSLLPPENATGNYVKVVQRIPVKILVDRAHGLVLRPGMNVNATVFTR